MLNDNPPTNNCGSLSERIGSKERIHLYPIYYSFATIYNNLT